MNSRTSFTEFLIPGTSTTYILIVSPSSNVYIFGRLTPPIAAFHNPLNRVIDKVIDSVDHVFASIRAGNLPSASFPPMSADSRSTIHLQDLDGPSAASDMVVAEELMTMKRLVLISRFFRNVGTYQVVEGTSLRRRHERRACSSRASYNTGAFIFAFPRLPLKINLVFRRHLRTSHSPSNYLDAYGLQPLRPASTRLI